MSIDLRLPILVVLSAAWLAGCGIGGLDSGDAAGQDTGEPPVTDTGTSSDTDTGSAPGTDSGQDSGPPDTNTDSGGFGMDTSDSSPVSDWCAVTAIFDDQCVTCHSMAGGMSGGLDLQVDPHEVLVNQPSLTDNEWILVTPDARDTSFLYAKVTGDLVKGQGGPMPFPFTLDADSAEQIGVWIDAGATEDCAGD